MCMGNFLDLAQNTMIMQQTQPEQPMGKINVLYPSLTASLGFAGE